MKSFLKKFPHLIALAAVCLLAVVMLMLGAPVAAAIVFIVLWQLLQFAMAKPGLRLCVSAYEHL